MLVTYPALLRSDTRGVAILLADFYIPSDVASNTSLSISEQLYTIRGSQGMVLCSYMEEDIGAPRGGTFLTNDAIVRVVQSDDSEEDST